VKRESKKLKLLGKLLGQDIYIDLKDCDPRVFDYAEKFLKENIKIAEELRKIKEIIN